MKSPRLVLCGVLALAVAVFAARAQDAAKPLNASQSLELAKKYLAEKDAAKKEALLAQAGESPADDPKPFLKLLLPAVFAPVKSGVQNDLKLDVPASISDKPVDYALSVPPKYAPAQLWPLIIGLHGGGSGTGSGKQHMSTELDATTLPAFFACPTSVDLGNEYYWRNPKNEKMIATLIQELSKQFPIDPDKIYLSGYSMGGIGTYYLGARMVDHFAAVAPGGGAWKGIFWAGMLNTPVYIWHGKRDMRGANFTDYPNAENAAACLKELGPGYTYEFHPMDCDHPNVPRGEAKAMAEWLLKQKRNPYPKRIVYSSCRARDFMVEQLPAAPDRWLDVTEVGDGELEMEGLEQGGTPRIKHKVKMGTVDATWTAPNALDVKTQNVKAFRVLLNPALLDFKKPLKITVNGKPGFEGPVKSSLKFALKYLDEHRDPGMLFVGEVVVKVDK